MRRWNGWGDDTVQLELPAEAERFLAERIGSARRPHEQSWHAALASVPDPALADIHPLVDTGAAARLRHAHGQSFPDWVALRMGPAGPMPDGVAFPETEAEVNELLEHAGDHGYRIIPYGGGTSVVGHVTPSAGDRPAITLSLARMNRLLELDTESELARFQAGTAGPEVESQLRAHGYTLGHYPQSFEHSTLGGWVATRSCGQESLRYGRMEQLLAGARLVTAGGVLDIPTCPASAAGPDLRAMLLGSEGRMGVLTEIVVRVRPVPAHERAAAVIFPDWPRARSAVQALARANIGTAMMRLSNPVETQTQLRLAGKPHLVALLERYLRLRGIGDEACLLMLGFAGEAGEIRDSRRRVRAICRRFGGVDPGASPARAWRRNRFRSAYLRNALWDAGYGVDTVETAVDWPRVDALAEAMEAAGREALAGYEEAVHAFTHLSHVYRQGSSIYTTYVFRLADDARTNLARWRALKTAVSKTIVAHGGTISHQHGVGLDHRDWLVREKGELGLGVIQSAVHELDPDGLLNPGKLVED